MGPSGNAALLQVIADIQGLLGVDEFLAGLLESLGTAIPSDYVSVNDIGPTPESSVVLARPGLPEEMVEVFNRLAHENPLVARYRRTRDGRTYRFSDLVSQKQLHALQIYRELYRPLGVEHQMAFTLPTGPDRILGVALSRGSPDYSDAERDLLNEARRFIIQAYQNSLVFDALRRAATTAPMVEGLREAGLTRREAAVLALIAYGQSNRDAARALQVAERTVAKHLERCFAKLGVRDRSQAAARAWQLASASLP